MNPVYHQMAGSALDDYPVVDGFLLRTGLRCNLTFLSLAIREYEALRRSANLRSRSWCIPHDPANQSIPALDSFEFQEFALPGSAIWGWTFVAPVGQFSWQLHDTCTDVPLFSEPVISNGKNNQQLLPKLLVVSKGGLLNVQICSLASADTFGVQLVLWGGEPVEGGGVC
jgi:hypothetical protein